MDQYEQVFDLAFNYNEQQVEARDADSGEDALLEDAPKSRPEAVAQTQTAAAWAAAARWSPWGHGQLNIEHGDVALAALNTTSHGRSRI